MKRIIYLIAIAVVSAFALTAAAQSTHKPIPGIDIKVDNCQRYSKGVLVNLTITNRNPYNHGIIFTQGGYGYDNSYATDDTGRKYKIRWFEPTEQNKYALFRGATVKAKVYVRDVPQSVKSLSILDWAVVNPDAPSRAKTAEKFHHYVFKDLQIEDFTNSDDSNASCTNPDLRVKPLSCERIDSKIKFNFLVTNTGRIDVDMDDLGLQQNGIEVYADNGNSYRCILDCGGVSDREKIILPVGVPVKLTVTTFGSVPLSVKSLQLVSIPMSGSVAPFEFAFRNIPIGWNDSTVSTDSQNN